MAPAVPSLPSSMGSGTSPGGFNPNVVPQPSQADLINYQASNGNLVGALNSELLGAIIAQNGGGSNQQTQPVKVISPCPEGQVCIQTADGTNTQTTNPPTTGQ